MIEVTTNRIDAENVELEIIVSKDMVDKEVGKTYQRISSGQSIRGFRQGKVPRDVIKNMFGAEAIAAQALQELLPDVFENAVEQAGVVPIDEPQFDPFPTLVEGEPMNVKVKLQVLPEYELFKYETIPVDLTREVVVTDNDVEDAIKEIQKNQAEFLPLVEDRGCAESDRVTLDYTIAVEGEKGPADEKKDLIVVLGENELLPDIEKNITGMKVGDKKDFSVTYPENYQNTQLANKKSNITIKINKVERRELPEINEEFMKKIGDFKDIDAFKEDVNKRLKLYKHSAHEEEIKRIMLQKALDGTQLEVPRKLVMEEIEDRIDHMRDMLDRQGVTLEDWLQGQGKTVEDVEEEEYHDARLEVKRRIVINKIFSEEKMQIFPNELEMAIQLQVYKMGLNKAEAKKLFRNRYFMMSIRDQVREQKVLRFLRSRVKFIDDPLEVPGEQKLETEQDNINIEDK